MTTRTARSARSPSRIMVMVTSLALVVTLLSVTAPTPAAAVGTLLFENDFNNRTVDGTGTVTKPAPAAGTNVACLTAAGNSATQPLLSCAGAPDAQGAGKLRLTNSTANQVGGIFGAASFPTSNGLDVTFNSYQWGGGAGDGMAFLLAAVDPANPASPTTIGPSGGSLGYSPAGSVRGLTNAYLGVGLDVFGNFSSTGFQGTGCTNQPNITAATPGAVVVRGPGNGLAGYCGLTTTSNGTVGSRLTLRAATRAASVVPVQVLVNPTTQSFTSDSGVSVSAGTYKVVVTPVGQATKTLSGALPTVSSTLYPSSSWLGPNGVPKQLAFGFVGSTGSVTDVHEITDTKVITFNAVPQLGVSTVSYAAPTSTPGDPVSYVITPRVLAGANESSPISVTQTAPTGVVPVGAFGTGWVCGAPVGQTVTCTTSGSSFAQGTTLPVINVVAIVTGASVSAAAIQAGSTVRASSADANPGTDTTATLGTLPPAPTGLAVSPTIGPIAGGGLVIGTGSSTVAPTAIEIGTVAEQQAGTPVVLLPCPGAAAAGCFTLTQTGVSISSMPPRPSAATVTVTVVTLGVDAAVSYVYADKPATPATPTATAGITSSTLTWAAPASNGSAITGYVVTPYRDGIAQSSVSFDASTTTRTFTGLTAAASYRYTVAAVNAYGTSTASAQSIAVVPYALPSAPATPTATAGSLSATLTWSAPAANGSAITGYVITPYLGTVAQTPQTFASTATTQTLTGLTAGTAYTFTVAAKNAAGTGPASAKSAAVTPNQAPSLTFAAPPAGQVGVAYSRQLTVTNGTSPFVWSVSGGSLPAGLTLNAATGLLSGTPTTAGSFDFVVSVVDASNLTATKSVTLVIAAAPVLTFVAAAGEVSVPYSQQPTLTGGTGPYVWTVSAGSLPAGITLNASTGQLSGTPTVAGSFPLTLSATDSFNQVASRTVTLVIVALPTFGTNAPPVGQVGVGYSHTFTVNGGSLPLVWSVSAGSLPPGLTLNSGTGAVTGTPTTAGSSSFTLSVVDANAKSATRSVTVVIGAGPLVITKTAGSSSAVAGGVVDYTITVTNTGSTAWTGATLSDPLTGVLDDATYNADATATAGTVTYAASTLSWTGTVPAGSTVTISYSVRVTNPDVGNKVLSNTVTSTTVGTNCASGSADARCSATVTVAGLTIVKTADVATTTPGATVRFTIVVTNSGQTAYAGATLTDSLAGVLDDATYNADGTATSGSIGYASPSLSWAGNLAVGASATITYSVTVKDPDPGNRSLTGTVVSPSAGSSCPSGNPAASCTATVTVLVPALSITNSATPGVTTPGGTVVNTVTVSNTGQTAYTGTLVTVALAGALDDARYDGDATASVGTVVYDLGTQTLRWTGNLAVGATAIITASVTVLDPDPGNKTLTTVVTSAAAGSTCPAGTANAACTTTVQVRVPQLTLTISAGATTTVPGAVVSHTVTVTNTGQTAYVGAAFADSLTGVLDDAVYNGDATASAGTVSFSAGTLTWSGNLAIGASATITYSITVDDPDNGNRSLNSVVTSTTPGSTCPTGGVDPRCASVVSVLIPGLTITNVADTATTTPGGVVRYTVTATNTGESTYSALAITLDLAGALDDADYNYDATITAGDLVTNPDGTVDWVLSLAPGASATGTVSVTVKDPAAGDRSLVVIAVSNAQGSSCPTGSADPVCTSEVDVLVPSLTITKTAASSTTSPGATVVYTIMVVNGGQTSYPAATFADSLTNALNDAVYNPGATTASTGTVSYVGDVLSWTGALAPGGSAVITYSMTVRDPDPGDKRILNSVVSSSAGSNCAAGSTDARCTAAVSVLVPGLTIVESADRATTIPGGTVAYTVTVTNSGASAYPAASFVDSLAGVLDDAVYNADATASSGSVSYAAPSLTWTGALAVGATAIITYSATVRAADTGDDLLTNTVSSSAKGSTCVANGTDPRCTVTVPVARLVLSQAYQESSTTPGSLLHLSATFTNTGQVPYTGITVSSPSADTVDDAIPTGDQVATSGTLILSSTAITWTGSIPVGGVVTITGTLTVQNPDNGNKIITGTLVSAAPGSNCPSGGTDPRCTALTTVLLPGLTITKTANATTAMPNDVVGYTITIANTGQTPYVAATVDDSLVGVLDDATYDANAEATSGTLAFTSTRLSWTGDLAVGQTVTITYSITTFGTATGDNSLINTVSSTAVGSSCPPASGNPACLTSIDVLTPGLTLTKTADVANATLGSVVSYTITVTNTGQTTYPAATFTDSLADVTDDATYGNNAVSSRPGSTVSYSGGVLTWSGQLSPGDSSTITYSVTIKNPNTLGDRSMINTVVSPALGSNCAAGSPDSRCVATVAVTNAVALTYTKTADVETTVAGATVTYTVTVVNATIASQNASFTDPLTGVLDDATYNNDVASTGGTAIYAAPNLTWTGSVPAGATRTVTYSVTVKGAITGDQILSGTLVAPGTIPSQNCAAASGDPRCTSVVPIARLELSQVATETTALPGSVVHLTATYTNTGQVAYDGISVSSPRANTSDDTIPTGDQVATSGSLERTATAITWSGSIPIGGSVTVTRTLVVKDPDPGNQLVTATLVTDAAGSNCPTVGAAAACTFAVPVLTPELTITKAASTTFTTPGGTVGYTITVSNTGESPYLGATMSDSLVGVLDDAVYNANATASSGTVDFASPTLTWTGDLAVGATATISYTVTARSPAPADKTMVNSAVSTTVGSTCPPASGNPACRSTVAVLTPGLTITTSASTATAVPGQTVSYTLVATNSGQVPFASANLSAPLSGLLDDAVYNGDAAATSGTVGLVGGAVVWSGALTTGGSVTITYTVTIEADVTGDHLLTQTATSTTPGSSCPVAGTDPRCSTSVAIASLQITNAADVATTKPTSVVRNTVTITNTGQVPFVGISISDSFVGSLDDATYNGDATATSGSLILVTGTGRIVWTGDVPVGATVVVTGSLTVNNPPLGDRNLSTRVSTDAVATNCPTATPAATCSTSVPVLIPGLTISKAAGGSTTTPGGVVGYTITVENTGETPYVGAVVTDTLDLGDARYDGTPNANSGTVSLVDTHLTWVGDLAVDEIVTITYTVKVDDPDLGDKLIVNVVTSDELGSSCPTGGSKPACSTLVMVLVPALDITVVADTSTTTPGSTVGYTVTVHNGGQTPYTGTGVSIGLDGVIDDATFNDDAAADAGSTAYDPQAPTVLSWTGNLAVGASVTITYSVTVNDPDSGNQLLSTAASSTAPGSSCSTLAPCTNTVTVLTPGLDVSTTADTTTTTPGELVEFTITVHNSGQTAYLGTEISTSLDDLLDDATFDGEITASRGVATFADATLTWTGTLQVGDTATIRYTVRVDDPATGDKLLTTTVIAAAPGSTCPSGSASAGCTATVDVLVPQLTISKSAGAPTTTPGGVVEYTIVIVNDGETAYVGATVSDSLTGVLPDSTYDEESATATTGVLSYAEPILTWTGDLAIGASATITYSITIDDPDLGDKHLTNVVTSSTPGSSCPPANPLPDCSAAVEVLVPALVVTKSADRSIVTAGDVVRYTITLTNTGQTDYVPATFTDSLTDVLDDADYNGDATTAVGALDYTNDTLSWAGSLLTGQTATITYSVTTRFPADGDKSLDNAVVSASAGSTCVDGTEPGCSTTVDVVVPQLTIAKSADTSEVVSGGTVRYTILATNTGAADYPTAGLTDALAGVVDDAAYNGDAVASTGTIAYAADTLTWTGALRQGVAVLISYSVTVAPAAIGGEALDNRVMSSSTGSNCGPASPDPRCVTSTPVAATTLTLTGLTESFTLSGAPNSTVTQEGAVSMTVTTNSSGGYRVTVQASDSTLTGSAHDQSIPIGLLSVRESGTTDYTPLSDTTSCVVHEQATASSPDGDAVSNDYRVEIPNVAGDTYSTTLEYVVTTL